MPHIHYTTTANSYIMNKLLVILSLFISSFSMASEVSWNSRLEGNAIVGSSMFVEDGDYASLGGTNFMDVVSFSYVRLGLNDRSGMSYDGVVTGRTIKVDVSITPFDDYGVALSPVVTSIEMEYSAHSSNLILDASDFRMDGVHKFSVEVTEVYIDGVPTSTLSDYVYLESGFYAERYYALDAISTPVISAQLIDYSATGVITVEASATQTSSVTDEIFLNWSYIDGAEYYDLEWTWVDNYSDVSITNAIAASSLAFSETDFKANSTRVRTTDQHYRLPQVFSKGYLIYRVRGVGRWLDATDKDLYGKWSSGVNAVNVSDWNYVTITQEHEQLKNWQYQATYAEDGKKKEVVQYFDGSLRGRQTVTRINSDNHSVVGETVYDNEGRGVIQILPVPQDNPAIQYYPSLNETGGVPYNHHNFDWEDTTLQGCAVAGADPLSTGAATYYSVNGYDAANDQDWQQYVPESNGYPFTQVEYTPDNTGRIRNQSGVGSSHKIGSNHETYYYYLQPSQSELDRLFGYKVGYKSRYKKNMVVDANGQVSVSYLDAQGRVIATAMAGDNDTQFNSLESEQTGNHVNSFSDLLNKLNPGAMDTDYDDNTPFSTNRFGALEDGLEMSTQIGVVDDATNFDFQYTAIPSVYSEYCDENGVSYPFVYDLQLSVLSDCGEEMLNTTTQTIGTFNIGATSNNGQQTVSNPSTLLDQGSYTVHKTLVVNEEALLAYKEHYLSDLNTCLLDSSHFLPEIESEPCPTSCEACIDELGVDLSAFKQLWVVDSLGANATVGSLLGSDTYYGNIYSQLKEDCLAGCEANFSCDAYHGMLKGDVGPGGQYFGTTSGDITVFTTGDWRGTDFINDLNNYYQENGDLSLIEAYPMSPVQLIPGTSLNQHQLADNGSTPVMVEPWELRRDDFIASFESSWSEALIQYHPEYPLYEYATAICTEQEDVSTVSSGTIPMSSELFDAVLRDQITDYTLASTNNYDINFLATLPSGVAPYAINGNHPLYAQDPYFNHTYGVHGTTYNTLKTDLMLEALCTDYKNTGMTMIQYAIETAINGNSFAAMTSPTNDGWSIVSGFTLSEQDLIWEKYKFYYLSYKGEINQLLMDFYGFDQPTPVFNGCIGPDALSSGIVESFAHSSFYHSTSSTPVTIVPSLTDLWFPGGTPNFPTSLCAPQFDNKIIRIVRMDALYDPGLDALGNISNLSNDADYAQWEQTGLCPLVADVEMLLNDMGVAGQLASTNSQLSINSFVPDLYEAFSGTVVTSALNNMTISGAVNGSNLDLSFSGATGMSSPAILSLSAPTNTASGSLSWSSYGTSWNIYSIEQSYVTGNVNNETKVVITAGATLATAQEYISTYTITGAASTFTDCQSLQNPANDPACTTEEQLEADLLNVIQNQIVNSAFSITTTITNDPVFVGTFLSELVVPATINDNVEYQQTGNQIKIITTAGNPADPVNFLRLSMSSSFPTGNFMLVDLDLDIDPTIAQGAVTLSFLNQATGDITEITGFYTYELGGDNITHVNVSCPCDDETIEPEAELLGLLSDFFNDMIAVGSTPTNYQPNSYLALNAYSPNNDLYTLYIDANGSGTPANFSLNYQFAFGGTVVSISPSNTNSLVSMTNFAYANGDLRATANFSDGQSELVIVSFADLVSFENITVECDDCLPVLQEPISCTDAYDDFDAKMQLIYNVASLSVDETNIYVAEHEISEEDFCGSSYAYITSAYINYLNNVQLTAPGESNYLTISEFGATPFGYSNTLLDPIVVLYDNSTASDPSSGSSYVTWNEFAANYFNSAIPAICPVTMGDPYFNIPPMNETPCAQWQNNVNIVNMQNQQTIYLEQMGDAFEQAYIEGAMSSVVETFTETHLDKEYHYTLYYYDRSGNLVQTVPPKGVDRFEYDATGAAYATGGGGTPATSEEINNFRMSFPEATQITDVTQTISTEDVAPSHTHETQYRYNSLNQLVYQHTPDGGESRFAYDELGRLIVSQNAKQLADNQMSYTLYDALGRVIEVGEMEISSSLVEITALGQLEYISGVNTGEMFDVNSLDWINLADPTEVTARQEVTRTVYDELDGITTPYNSGTLISPIAATTQIQGLFGSYAADNTRNRIVGVVYQEDYVASTDTYESATFYDYDVHGNVKELVQVHTATPLVDRNQHIKHAEYDYDLVSGNVNKVTYQKDQEDQFMHRYNYDSDNRITIAETSKDGIVWEKDAKYFYYEHGPLARTEIGEGKVQSMDYAYTIQGWLKAVNGEQVDHNKMMGQDGKQATLNAQGGRDAFGFSLSYFDNDYQSSQTQMLNYTASLNDPTTSIYNGNIRMMQTALVDVDENMGINPLKTHQTTYGYDQLNRINSMSGAYREIGQLAVASNYSSSYSFDENGNLETLQRYADNGGVNTLMDDFDYAYDVSGFNNGENNRLLHVTDNAGVSLFADADIDNSMLANNYDYDEIGQLIQDTDEGILNIEWKVTNKVEEVQIDTDGDLAADKFIHFDYDPMGNRIAKHVTENSETSSTFYILDAQGNPMSIYTYTTTDSKYKLSERSMYGSSRVGMENVHEELGFRTMNQSVTNATYYSTLNYTGDKNYELSNHLGNVLEVITDRKLPTEGTTGITDYYTADVIAFNDYYPYGMVMPGRFSTGSDYRYSFQGQEKDDEIKDQPGTSINYKYRMHDPRIGRFFAVDPLTITYPYYSPYSFSGNEVLIAIELEGLEPSYIFNKTTDKENYKPNIIVSGMFAELYGPSYWKVMGRTNVQVDQGVHDRLTGYTSGAITLGMEIYFTSNYASADGESWLSLFSHEVVHVRQFTNAYGFSFSNKSDYQTALNAWQIEYGAAACAAFLFETDPDKDLHDRIPIEQGANEKEDLFAKFYESENYDDGNGNSGNHILDILKEAETALENKENEKYTELYNSLIQKVKDFKEKEAQKEQPTIIDSPIENNNQNINSMPVLERG